MLAGLHSDSFDRFLVADIHFGQNDFQLAACVLHGLIGVGAQIHDDLMDLGGITHNGTAIVLYFMNDLYGGWNRCPQKLESFCYDILYLYRLAFLIALTAECQNLLNQILGAIGGYENFSKIFMGNTVFGNFIHGQFGIPDDWK